MLGRWKMRVLDLESRLARVEGWMMAQAQDEREPEPPRDADEDEEGDESWQAAPLADNSQQINR